VTSVTVVVGHEPSYHLVVDSPSGMYRVNCCWAGAKSDGGGP
jgi:hypothetical protein